MSSFKYWIRFKDFLQFSSLEKSCIYILICDRFYYNKTAIQCLLLFSLVSNNFKNYGRRHLKIFTNCHVSWDTLYNIKYLGSDYMITKYINTYFRFDFFYILINFFFVWLMLTGTFNSTKRDNFLIIQAIKCRLL